MGNKIQYGRQKYICYHIFACESSPITNLLWALAAVTQGIDIPGFTPEHTMQYIADNVDHNIVTVDGTGTFHGMGIIAAVTPGTQAKKHILKANMTAAGIDAVAMIASTFGTSRTLQHYHLLHIYPLYCWRQKIQQHS